ncbi:DUF3667 domain-containing protein [Flavobacteriaceae bacterium]|nr:DUF3667 domain-containing protein [Flavobacteriaceae bacterium]
MKKTFICCKNCEMQFESSFQFCPYCGQKSNDELTIGLLFYDTISNYFSFDARFFKSFFPLIFRPGYLANRFIAGKRLMYLHPAQLYLFISVVFFFLLSFTIVRKQVEDFDITLKKTFDKPLIIEGNQVEVSQVWDSIQYELNSANNQAKDSLLISERNNSNIFDLNKIDSLISLNSSDAHIIKEMGVDDDTNMLTIKFYTQLLKLYKERNGGQLLQAFYDTIPISLFILLPIFAFILKLLFYKRGRYAHHLVFSFYFFSFLFTVFSIILLLNEFIDIPDWLDFLIAISTFFYLLVAIKRFYKHDWLLSLFKTGVTTVFYLLFVIPIAIVIMSGVSLLFY